MRYLVKYRKPLKIDMLYASGL